MASFLKHKGIKETAALRGGLDAWKAAGLRLVRKATSASSKKLYKKARFQELSKQLLNGLRFSPPAASS